MCTYAGVPALKCTGVHFMWDFHTYNCSHAISSCCYIRYFVGYFARAEVVINDQYSNIGGDSSDCPTYINGKCFSCPSDCTMTSTAISGDSDFVCNCKCADGSETKCIVANAPAPLAEEYQAKLEEGKEKLAEGQEKLAEGREKLAEEQKKLEEAKQMMG